MPKRRQAVLLFALLLLLSCCAVLIALEGAAPTGEAPLTEEAGAPTVPPAVLFTAADARARLQISAADVLEELLLDLDRDGTNDIVLLHTPLAGERHVEEIFISAINGETGLFMDTFTLTLTHSALLLETLHTTSFVFGDTAAPDATYLVAGGALTGTVEHVAYAVLRYTETGFENVFQEHLSRGIAFTVVLQNGPTATILPEVGEAVRLAPDKELYIAEGWVNESGRLQAGLQPVDDAMDFMRLTFDVAPGPEPHLLARGVQEVRGLHKLDVLALLHSEWVYDGSAWSVSATLEPLVPLAEEAA